jgi:hypothetical protein
MHRLDTEKAELQGMIWFREERLGAAKEGALSAQQFSVSGLREVMPTGTRPVQTEPIDMSGEALHKKASGDPNEG